MASACWSELSSDILSTITKILNTDVEILRLRSVCSSWRSSIPPRRRPSPFPLKVPPVISTYGFHRLFGSGDFFLNYTTLYRLSRPEHGPHAGDPSDGWLFRVLEVNPNRFSFQAPLFPKIVNFPPYTIPKHLNLLDYRITEVCKCYHLDFVDPEGFLTDATDLLVKKVLVLCNCALYCDFTVLVLSWDSHISYWRFGDKEWTPIVDAKSCHIGDMVVCNEICYAISEKGVLYSFDSNLSLKVVRMPHVPVNSLKFENFLVECKSDLYVVVMLKTSGDHGDEDDDSTDREDSTEIPGRLAIYKKCGNWKQIRCLGDAMFLSCDTFSVGLLAEDFRACKGNCVYLAHADFLAPYSNGDVTCYSVCDLAEGRIRITDMFQDRTLVYWPPPEWLMS